MGDGAAHAPASPWPFSLFPRKTRVADEPAPTSATKRVHFEAPGSEEDAIGHGGDEPAAGGCVPRTGSSASSTSAEKLHNFRTSMNRAVHTVTDNIQRLQMPAMPNMPDLGAHLRRGIPRQFLANRCGARGGARRARARDPGRGRGLTGARPFPPAAARGAPASRR